MPVGVSSSLEDKEDGKHVHLYGIVLTIDGSKSVEGDISGPVAQAEVLGSQLARQLKERGAAEILDEIAAQTRK